MEQTVSKERITKKMAEYLTRLNDRRNLSEEEEARLEAKVSVLVELLYPEIEKITKD